MSTTIAVLGDVHVTTGGVVPAAFTGVVRAVSALRPRCVVLCGDATSGNPDDGYPIERVRIWWRAFQEALAPLRAEGTPILAIAGNHDFYTKAHQDGYREAWADLRAWAAPLSITGAPPLSYSCDVDGFHLSLAHVIDQDIEGDVARWLAADLAGAAAAKARICFGHVPLISAMGHSALAAGGAQPPPWHGRPIDRCLRRRDHARGAGPAAARGAHAGWRGGTVDAAPRPYAPWRTVGVAFIAPVTEWDSELLSPSAP